MAGVESIDVEVVYALSHVQQVVSVRVAAGTSVAAAIRQSGILADFPEIELSAAKLGIFGRRVSANEVVQPGDRIEIYRPLVGDPGSQRRRRARRHAARFVA
ncbi:MAG: RnfH family protein [Burkholderiales bacterium]|nr:RnfH family protein [Burkholderiales bacterium]